ncbi:protein serine threonine [Stylonychia lemnae]|uniref:Protein serine threonine n=1 Tax=Stylonychia lemnae TaxID=5949 RepID=A0A077ZVV6_STYLE|nr:protein serine threonine [Stylonychia lemnae]|eukprot:CDW73731.1 protein serine threonine [Stylonychia lemnae]
MSYPMDNRDKSSPGVADKSEKAPTYSKVSDKSWLHSPNVSEYPSQIMDNTQFQEEEEVIEPVDFNQVKIDVRNIDNLTLNTRKTGGSPTSKLFLSMIIYSDRDSGRSSQILQTKKEGKDDQVIASADGKRQTSQSKLSSSKRGAATNSNKKILEGELDDGPEMKNITESNKSNSMKYLYNSNSLSMRFPQNGKDIIGEQVERNNNHGVLGDASSSIYDKIIYLIRFIGGIMSLFALVGQILYFAKQEFASQTMFDSYIGVIIMRVVLILITTIVFFYQNVAKYNTDMMNLQNFNSAREPANQEDLKRFKKRTCFQAACLYASYPFMLWFGFYRVYKPKDFQSTIFLGYFYELFFSLIPIIFIQQTTNNTLKVKTMNRLQNYSLAIQILVILEIFLEFLIIYCEYQRIQKLRKEGMDNTYEVQPLNEEEKRHRNFKHSVFISALAFSTFFFFIGLGMDNLNGRKCTSGQGIKNGVCLDCLDFNCKSCGSDANVCQSCYDGFYNIDGQCQKCDPDSYCAQCDNNGVCLKCAHAHVLTQGKCLSCTRDVGCAECDNLGCKQCLDGYYMNAEKRCIACSSTMHNCQKCDSSTHCTQCVSNITTLFLGACQCNFDKNWIKVQSQQDQGFCQCNNYVVGDTNECKTCAQIFPGCNRCAETNSFINAQYRLGHSSYNPNQMEYVRCADCGQNNFFSISQTKCLSCSQLTYGCKECNSFGQICDKCQDGFVRVPNPVVDDSDEAIIYLCENCNKYLSNCATCSSTSVCSSCVTGYTLTNGTCIKK